MATPVTGGDQLRAHSERKEHGSGLDITVVVDATSGVLTTASHQPQTHALQEGHLHPLQLEQQQGLDLESRGKKPKVIATVTASIPLEILLRCYSSASSGLAYCANLFGRVVKVNG